MKIFINDKSKLNLSLDTILFLLMMSMAGIGFLMKLILVPGFKRNFIYGSNIDLQFLGLTRHQWGTIHLILGISFLVLLIIHIILHWKTIVCILQRVIPGKGKRVIAIAIIACLSFLMISFSLFIKPEQVQREPHYRNRTNNLNTTSHNQIETPDSEKILDLQTTGNLNEIKKGSNQYKKAESEQHDSEYEEYEVFGFQTLQFIADKYSVPVGVIAKDLNLPIVLVNKKLGQLKKQYSFTMKDVRKSIYDYKKVKK